MKQEKSKKVQSQMSRIAKNISAIRTEQNMSQGMLATKAGIDRKTVNRIENNHYSPSLETYFSICAALRVDVAELMS
jgi:DNA-binding XRE family transcriptional regulator